MTDSSRYFIHCVNTYVIYFLPMLEIIKLKCLSVAQIPVNHHFVRK